MRYLLLAVLFSFGLGAKCENKKADYPNCMEYCDSVCKVLIQKDEQRIEDIVCGKAGCNEEVLAYMCRAECIHRIINVWIEDMNESTCKVGD